MKITQIKPKKIEPFKVDSNIKQYSLNSSDNYPTIESLFHEDIYDNEDDSVEMYVEQKGISRTLNFDVTDLPNCCGVREIGNIECNNSIDTSDITKLLDCIVRSGGGLTYIVNTNGTGYCIPFEKALAKCEYFTLVKTFKNPNSSNIIKMWISNNG